MANVMATTPEKPQHINPVHWQQSLGVARQASARIFRDGGTPDDALKAFGLKPVKGDWSKAIEAIAEALCARPMRLAA